MTNKVKDHTGFYYLLTEIQLCTFKEEFITRKTFRTHSDDSILYGFYCITIIEYIIAGNTLLDYTNLFRHNFCKKNDKIMYKFFKDEFTSLVGAPVGIASSAVGLKVCAIIAVIKKYKSIIKKKM